jgi:hypothetical protein
LEAEQLIGELGGGVPHGRVLLPGVPDTLPFIHTPLVFLEKGGEHVLSRWMTGAGEVVRPYAQDGEAVGADHERRAMPGHRDAARRIGRTRTGAVVREHGA